MHSSTRSHCRHVVVGLLSLLAAIAYLSRNAISVFAADEQFLADFSSAGARPADVKAQLSQVMSAFFWAYAVLQIPGGWLGQRYGARMVLALYMGVCSVLTLLMGTATSIAGLMLVQAVLGATQAGMFPTAMRSVADWVPLHRRGIASGTLGAAMQIGAALTTAIVGSLLAAGFDWRQTFLWLAVPAVLWTIVFAVWFRNHPEEHPRVTADELSLIKAGRRESSPAEAAVAPNWRAILTCRSLWAINLQQFFRAAAYVFFATWFPTFLRQSFGVSVKDAGWLASIPMLSILLGGLSGGWFIDWILKQTGSRRLARQAVAAVSLTICAGFIGSTFWAHDARLAILLIAVATYFSGVAGCCGYTQTLDIAGRQVPVVFGMMNMLGNIGAALCPPIVTWLVDWTGRWDVVLFFVSGIYLASVVSWLFVDPDRTIDG